MREWRTIFHANRPQKNAGLAILISDKLDFKLKTVVRDTEGHYVILKGSIQQEDITIVKYLCPQHGSRQLHKTTANQNKETY